MLEERESAELQRIFGVPLFQVERDHAISHVLSALQNLQSDFVFFGGTALARTYLTSGRLSEDIDIYANDRKALCDELEHLPEWIEEEFPDASWTVLPSNTTDPQSALLNCDSGIHISLQIVDGSSRGWKHVPTAISTIEQRFSDVPKTELKTPTFDGFVAMKALVWFQRHSPRDLFDLAELSKLGPVTTFARETIEAILGFSISTSMMKAPVFGDWRAQLGHQTRNFSSEEICLDEVLRWWDEKEPA